MEEKPVKPTRFRADIGQAQNVLQVEGDVVLRPPGQSDSRERTPWLGRPATLGAAFVGREPEVGWLGSAFDERHPLSLGAGGLTATKAARQWIDECDVLLAVGASLTDSPYAQDIPNVAVLPRPVVHGHRRVGPEPNRGPRRSLTFTAVTFEGLLRVTDIQAFREALKCGIGSGKAYGFGLLSIAPAGGPP